MDWFEEFKKEWHEALDEDDATWMITGDSADKPRPPSLFERIEEEIRAALRQAERKGEQRMWTLLMGEGSGPSLGVVEQGDGTIKGRYPGKNYARQFTASNLPNAPLQVKERFAELLDTYPELTRPQAYIQAVIEADEPIITKDTILNLDGWRYCVMKVKSGDDQASLD